MALPQYEENSRERIGEASANESSQLLLKHITDQEDKGHGLVTLWAAWGLIWTVISLQAVIRWIFSPDFRAAPVLGPQKIEIFRLVMLRIVEAASISVQAAFVIFCVIAPLWTTSSNISGNIRKYTGELSLDGKFVIGGVFAWIADSFLNCRKYLFAWNAHSINMGVWTRFMPFHAQDGPLDYAESLLWGMPMYVYFCAGVAIVACSGIKKLRRRWPKLRGSTLVVVIWLAEFLFDFLVENIIIRSTHAYGFSQTYRPLTLFPGEVHQFPIYESIFVATLGSTFTWVRLAALNDPDGISVIEHGYEQYPEVLQSGVRILAVIGFCSLSAILMYHLPFNWLGLIGDSIADLPSYMLPGNVRN